MKLLEKENKTLNEMPASGKGGEKPYPIDQWFMNTKQQLMSVVYWSQRQLPPSDMATYNREFIKIVKQLQQRHPASEERFQELLAQGKSMKMEGKLNEAPMDDRFAKEYEMSTKAFINHIKHELSSAEGADKSVLKKMLQNLMTVSGYPQLMARMTGMKETKSSKLKDILENQIITEGPDITELEPKDLIGVRFVHQTGLSGNELKDLEKIIKKFVGTVNSPMRKPKLSTDELAEIFARLASNYIK